MSILFDEYGNRLRRLKRHTKTISAFETAATRYTEWCDENGIAPEDAKAWQIEEYFAGLPYTTTTKRNHLVHISAAYNYAITRGVMTVNPCRLVELPRIADTTPRILSIAELREMRDTAKAVGKELIFALYAYTGMRQAEGSSLPWSGIDLENRTIEIIGKGGKRRFVPIHPALGEILSVQKQDTWLFPGRKDGTHAAPTTLHYQLRKITPTATFHDFRRTVANSLDTNGVDEGLIFDIMGWSKTTVFHRHYRNVAPERLQQAILRLYANDPL